MDPLYLQKKLDVHAPRDGTAAGRHGGAAREHVIFTKKIYLGLLVGYTVLYSTVQSRTVLNSTVQYCTVQYCTILYSTVEYCTVYSTV